MKRCKIKHSDIESCNFVTPLEWELESKDSPLAEEILEAYVGAMHDLAELSETYECIRYTAAKVKVMLGRLENEIKEDNYNVFVEAIKHYWEQFDKLEREAYFGRLHNIKMFGDDANFI